ncbi:hypothetical protein [Sinomonas mesophila]|uniref:hypothetical protein n=1 Tax=Sinomonas mesophila TaxID=1531955 RepID=UPI000984E762|nr:hypothetical protein [Sinomonas mesophila]
MSKTGRGGTAARGTAARGTGGRPGTRRQSPAVYRRRRLVVLVLLLAVLGAIGLGAWGIARAVGPEAAPAGPPASPEPGATDGAVPATPGAPSSATASPAATSTGGAAASQSASPSAPAPPACDWQLITVSAATDKPAYAAGENPVFSLKVTNGNPVPCDINVGTTQMEFLVVSGVDRIFSSKDCQAEAADLVKTLPAGGSETANFPWSRVRSVAGCTAVPVQPRPGVYVLTTSLGTTTSSKAVFSLG